MTVFPQSECLFVVAAVRRSLLETIRCLIAVVRHRLCEEMLTPMHGFQNMNQYMTNTGEANKPGLVGADMTPANKAPSLENRALTWRSNSIHSTTFHWIHAMLAEKRQQHCKQLRCQLHWLVSEVVPSRLYLPMSQSFKWGINLL